MGAIWAHKLPQYLAKHGVAYKLRDGWQTRSRSSGGFDNVMGVIIHHDASGLGTDSERSFGWSCVSSPDRPIGNGSLSRDGVFHLWAAGAANTAGKGGPVRSSRGLIGLDNGNRNTFNIEADNNGVGEVWTDVQVDAYVKLVAAVIDWANNETPGAPLTAADVWSHAQWAPTRKIDPRGPAKGIATGIHEIWNMDKFRGLVLRHQLSMVPAAPTPVAKPVPAPSSIPNTPDGDEDVKKILVRHVDGRMFCTDLATYAHYCTEAQGERLRDFRGAEVGPDGPFPLDQIESDYVASMAS